MKKTPVIIVAAVVVVVALVAVVAASGGKKSPTTSNSASSTAANSMSATANTNAVAADKVSISNYMFAPGDIKVKVGTTVTWTNQDSVRHNVVSDDGMMPDGKLIAMGETYSYTFSKAGSYKYHCSPHPYMHGSVTVE